MVHAIRCEKVLHFMLKCDEIRSGSGSVDIHWILLGKQGIYPDLPSLIAHFTVRQRSTAGHSTGSAPHEEDEGSQICFHTDVRSILIHWFVDITTAF